MFGGISEKGIQFLRGDAGGTDSQGHTSLSTVLDNPRGGRHVTKIDNRCTRRRWHIGLQGGITGDAEITQAAFVAINAGHNGKVRRILCRQGKNTLAHAASSTVHNQRRCHGQQCASVDRQGNTKGMGRLDFGSVFGTIGR